VEVSNSTVYNSGRNWQFDESAAETMNQHVLRNNITFAGTSSDNFDSGVTDSFNTWNGIPVNAADFLSLDDTIARGPRNPDGSLPISDFLRLAANSNLIDTGTDVGLPFNGTAPDLGAFETSPVVFAAGDFNEDGSVDADDLAIWQGGYGTAVGADRDIGDADEDNDVDAADYLAWQRDYTGTPSLAAANVPEPTANALLILATLAIGTRRQAI
jgi:hypothetical protein